MNLILSNFLQVVVACTLLNVWLIQAKKPTPYRGGNAQNLADEFKAYGLPSFAFYSVGAIKVLGAIALLVGIWLRPLVTPAAAVIALLMIGAIAMHLKIADPLKKSMPALMLFVFCGLIIFLNYF